MNRIEKLKKIAIENGVDAHLREYQFGIMANVNGCTFKVRGFLQFESKCKELKKFTAPERINLTDRIERIELSVINQLQ